MTPVARLAVCIPLLLAVLLAPGAEAAANGKVYWGQGTSLWCADLDGSNPETLITGAGQDPRAIAVDPVGGRLYWAASAVDSTTPSGIRSANVDGSDVQIVVSNILVRHLALDGAGKMYWTQGLSVQRANVDGTAVETLASSELPYGIAVDTAGGKVYWTDIALDKIFRMNLDGTGEEEFLATTEARALAIDVPGRRLYYGRTSPGFGLYSVPLDGAGPTTTIHSTDVVTGVSLDLASDRVYWWHSLFTLGTLRRANLDGTDLQSLLTRENALYLAVSATPGGLRDVFWTDRTADELHRTEIDGTGDVVLAGTDPDPLDVEIDALAGHIYTLDASFGLIVRSGLDGSNAVAVVDEEAGSQTRGLALDPAGGRMYWLHGSEIRRAMLDGSDVETVETGLAATGGDLTLDVSTGRIYYGHSGSVYRANMNGAGSPVPLFGATDLTGIAFSGGKLYFAANGILERANPDGSARETLATAPQHFRVAVDQEAAKVYWTERIVTGSGITGSVFRANLDGTSVRRLTVSEDAHGVALHTMPAFENKIYWTDNLAGAIRRTNVNGSVTEDVLSVGAGFPEGIAWERNTSKIYWVDGTTDKIRRANLDGSGVEDLVTSGLSGARDLALDWQGGRMYWVDRGANRVARANLDGSDVQVLFSGVDDPKGVDLDPAAGKIYWGDNITNRIARGNMDGTGSIETVVPDAPHPFGVALDLVNGKVYWSDDVDDTIERANLDGTGREVLVTGQVQPFHLALDVPEGKMYWTENTTKAVRRANLDGTGMETIVSAPGTAMLGIFVITNGTTMTSAPVAAVRPGEPMVLPPFPNPFASGTSLAITHPGGAMQVDVFDVTGRLVRTLATGPREAGQYTVVWDGRDRGGLRTAPGMYFFRYRGAEAEPRTVKGVLLR